MMFAFLCRRTRLFWKRKPYGLCRGEVRSMFSVHEFGAEECVCCFGFL